MSKFISGFFCFLVVVLGGCEDRPPPIEEEEYIYHSSTKLGDSNESTVHVRDDVMLTLVSPDVPEAFEFISSNYWPRQPLKRLVSIDLTDPDQPIILDQYPLSGSPMGISVSGDYAAVLVNDAMPSDDLIVGVFAPYWPNQIVFFDVSDPGTLRFIEAVDIFGSSELYGGLMKGDVFYAVYEEFFCEPRLGLDCESGEGLWRHVVESISLADGAPRQLERLELEGLHCRQDEQCPLLVTPERIYFASGRPGENFYNMFIQVVDISEPGGAIAEGARIDDVGYIDSSPDIDELDGVLRIISQDTTNSVFETYEIMSSYDLHPLGRLEIENRGESSLWWSQFDGTRAYFTTNLMDIEISMIDLSIPEEPRMRGEALKLVGDISLIEARGDRLYVIGYEGEGAVLSHSDVSDIDAPRLLDRISVGGVAPSRNDRIRALSVIEESDLVLVSVSPADYEPDVPFDGGGLYVFNARNDVLFSKGFLRDNGVVTHAQMVRDRLVVASEEKVTTFDIDGDALSPTGSVSMTKQGVSLGLLPEHLVALEQDRWTGESRLELYRLGDSMSGKSIGSVEIPELIESYHAPYRGFLSHEPRVFTFDDTVAVVWVVRMETHISVIDIATPESPQHLAHMTLPFVTTNHMWNSRFSQYDGESVVQLGRQLVFQRPVEYESEQRYVEVVDFSDPSNPTHVESFTLSANRSGALFRAGDVVLSSHWEPCTDDSCLNLRPTIMACSRPESEDRGGYVLDQIDFSTPEAPRLLEPLPLPGGLYGVEPSTGRLLTLRFELSHELHDISYWDCLQTDREGHLCYDCDNDSCSWYERLLETHEIDDGGLRTLGQLTLNDRFLMGIQVSSGRVFATTFRGYGVIGGATLYGDDHLTELLTLNLSDDGTLELSSRQRSTLHRNILATSENDLITSSQYPAMIDAYSTSRPEAPELLGQAQADGHLSDVLILDDGTVVLAGDFGLQFLPVPSVP